MGVGKVPGETEGSSKRAYKVTMKTLWAAPTMHRDTYNLSGEMCRYLSRQTSKGKERLGVKAANTPAHEGNVSKMIYFCESTVK